jgi:glucose 1-dehydrogenase
MAVSPTGKSPALPLADAIAIISGGLGDIGRATAHALRCAGATVALGDVIPHRRARLAMPGFHYTRVDVTRETSVRNWLGGVEKKFGVPTIIVSNAAIVRPGGSCEATDGDWRATIDVNLTGAFLVARCAAQGLKRAKLRGRIILVGSWAAHAPHPHLVAYCVAKAGLRMAMKCLALELAPFGIAVNELAPGFVDAGLSAKLFSRDLRAKEKAKRKVPLARLMNADDVARGVLELCQPDDRHRTGSVLLLDGGLSLVSAV